MSFRRFAPLWLMGCCWPVLSQTTQAVISGRVYDAITGDALPHATILYTHLGTGVSLVATPRENGAYVLPLLAPGVYRIRVDAGRNYQPREAAALRVAVAASLQVDFDLRPITDLWEAGQPRSVFTDKLRTSVNFYGPDVDFSRSGSFLPPDRQETRIDASISTAVTPSEVDQLPFPGRDAYSAIVLQPLVTSSTTTARGLGISANGQRPGSGNYLLDGVTNNAYLVGGPLVITPVETIQEYRVSLANYSAEFGGTSAFIANSITQSGINGFHGLGYGYLMNDVLDANDVELRYSGLPRYPFKELQSGFRVGGPLLGRRLFGSASLEYLRSRGFSPCQVFSVPASTSGASGAAAVLLGSFRPAADTGCRPGFVATPIQPCPECVLVHIRPTESVNSITALPRLDWLLSPAVRLFGRVALSRFSRPDYSFSPYPAFTSGLGQNATSAVVGLEASGGILSHEGWISFGRDSLGFGRAQPNLPNLETFDNTSLPTSGLEASFRYRGSTFDGSYNLLIAAGRHMMKVGAGSLARWLDTSLDAGGGSFLFDSFESFLADQPFNYSINLLRTPNADAPFSLADPRRNYRYNQFFGFFEDSWRVSHKLVLTGGLRWDYFGDPRNTGPVPDVLIDLAQSSDPAQRAAQAQFATRSQLYSGRPEAWSLRSGAAYALRPDGRTIFRAGFGTFRDPIAENLWLNVQENQYETASAGLVSYSMTNPVNFWQTPAALLGNLFAPGVGPALAREPQTLKVVTFDSGLKTPLVRSGFLALDQEVERNWHIEGIAISSTGRQLLSNDILNRLRGDVRPDNDLPPIYDRGNLGLSDYRALAVRTRIQGSRFYLEASYTLSSSHDNQSDPLAGDFDLLETQTQSATPASGEAAFTAEMQPQYDFGHSDFDQRHNFVIYSAWNVPALFPTSRFASVFRNWAVAGTGAIRSGQPFTIQATSDTGDAPSLENVRAELVCSSGYLVNLPLARGRELLNPNCFQSPKNGANGNTPRNGFYGPGAWNFDLSVSRSFRLPIKPEGARLTIRADAYNVLNHANLGNPETSLTCAAGPGSTPPPGCPAQFGQALYGRTEGGSDFPPNQPFTETGRQIQLMLRLQF